MTASLLLRIGSTFTLDGSNGIKVQNIQEDQNSRINPSVIPRRHGSLLINNPYIDSKVISISGRIIGTSAEDYRTKVDAFKAILEGGLQKFYKLDDRYIWFNKSQLLIPDYQDAKQGAFNLNLICKDPFWYALTESSFVVTTSSTSYNFSPVIFGNAPTPPRITFSQSTTSVKLLNSTNGSKWFQHTHSYAGLITINAVDHTDLEATTNAKKYLTGEFWELLTGTNLLTFTQPGAVSTTITVYWTDRFF